MKENAANPQEKGSTCGKAKTELRWTALYENWPRLTQTGKAGYLKLLNFILRKQILPEGSLNGDETIACK